MTKKIAPKVCEEWIGSFDKFREDTGVPTNYGKLGAESKWKRRADNL
jgi:hypothetical protein